MKQICLGCQKQRSLDKTSHCTFSKTELGYDIYICSCGAIMRVSNFTKETEKQCENENNIYNNYRERLQF